MGPTIVPEKFWGCAAGRPRLVRRRFVRTGAGIRGWNVAEVAGMSVRPRRVLSKRMRRYDETTRGVLVMAARRGSVPGAGDAPGPALVDAGRAEVSGPLVVRPGLVLPAHELTWRFSRSSGPGGQGVNTADSRVELLFDVAASAALPEPLRERALERLAGRLVDGRLSVVSSELRSQLVNRRAARARLAALLAGA